MANPSITESKLIGESAVPDESFSDLLSQYDKSHSRKRDDGSKQWAYKGKPLYYWKDDKKGGDVEGDNRNNIWHVVAP